MAPFLRGQVFWFHFDDDAGRRPYIVVSNNSRNRNLGSALVVPVTTTDRSYLASAAVIPAGECVVGFAMCDNVTVAFESDNGELEGALGHLAMERVGNSLRAALAL